MAASSTSISQSTAVMVAANVIGVIWISFGIYDIVSPEEGLTFFEFQPPALPSERAMVNSLVFVIGIRDVFIGLAIHMTAYLGNRAALGWMLLAASAEAFLDGVVCYQHGKGEWNHWGYAPILTVIGLLLLGLFDSRRK